jgi:predicted RNase H-like HicB family nuclease
MMDERHTASRYALIIEWSDEDQLYSATAPELPGCRTHGLTRAEAIEKGAEAIESWLLAAADDNWELPEPRIFDGWSNFAVLSQPLRAAAYD